MPIRTEFPPVGNPSYLEGECDGWEYRISFVGSSWQAAYDMVCNFLEEEGYGDLPLPADAKELRYFRRAPQRAQLALFKDDENGYVHNPIRILFPPKPRFRYTLLLCLYNEAAPFHLLRFHKKIAYKEVGHLNNSED